MMEMMGVPAGGERGYTIQPGCKDGCFFPGRSATVTYQDKPVAVFGVVHPEASARRAAPPPCCLSRDFCQGSPLSSGPFRINGSATSTKHESMGEEPAPVVEIERMRPRLPTYRFPFLKFYKINQSTNPFHAFLSFLEYRCVLAGCLELVLSVVYVETRARHVSLVHRRDASLWIPSPARVRR